MHCTQRRSNLLLAGFALLLAACADPTEPGRSLSPDINLAARVTGTADPTVTSADPSEAEQGTTLDVQINGSGFDRGSLAHWERNGVVDPRVRVNSTRFVKSTQLVANLTIALDAEVSPYDIVVVTAAGKKGIGTEKFTVRLADALPTWTLTAESLNMASDGKGDYASGQCGVEGKIFYSNYNPATGIGGDATFENINPSKAGCGPRSVSVTIDGVAHNVSAWNVLRVVGLSVGTKRDQNFGFAIDGLTKCTRLVWSTDDGGGGGQITVTRTSLKEWTAVTSGTARCTYFVKQTRFWGAIVSDVQIGFIITEPE